MNARLTGLLFLILFACNQTNQPYLEQAKYYAANKDPLGVVVACNAGLQQNNYSDSLYFYRAMGFGAIKKFENALLDWQQFVSKYPNCDTCFLAIAKTQLQLGDTLKAEKTLRTSKFNDGHFLAQSIIEQAMIAFYQKKWKQSLVLLNKSSAILPKYFLPYYYKGYYFSQFAGADEQLAVELKTYPCLNFDSALFYFEIAIDLNPNFADSYYRKGLVFENTFRNDSALQYYDLALAIDSIKPYWHQRNEVLKKIATP